jgi:hypothetical protein
MSQTKLSILKAHAAAGEWQKAIAIAARFPDLGKERAAILDAHTAYTNPRWTAAMKRDAEADKASGRDALVRRYAIEALV